MQFMDQFTYHTGSRFLNLQPSVGSGFDAKRKESVLVAMTCDITVHIQSRYTCMSEHVAEYVAIIACL